jgi:hypothetical protein
MSENWLLSACVSEAFEVDLKLVSEHGAQSRDLFIMAAAICRN